jgi:hypothetical protein
MTQSIKAPEIPVSNEILANALSFFEFDHLQRFLEFFPVATYICDMPLGTIRVYNKRAVELWGRSRSAATRTTVSAVLINSFFRTAFTCRIRKPPWPRR